MSDADYQRDIATGLSRALGEASIAQSPFRLGRDRMILFSDLHKGGRNGADDFRRCERAYNAALAYYYELGYWLAEVGDVEELWEERAKTVVEQYAYTLALTAKFHRDPEQRGTQYFRVWGNHDDEWNRPAKVKQYLSPIFDTPGKPALKVHGSVLIPVEHPDGTPIGNLFLAHGHQGTFESDKASWFSRLAVRYVWRPFQRVTNRSLNTPATDWELNHKHNIAMNMWLDGVNRPDLIFIAGHTHRPVFRSKSHEQLLTQQLTAATTPQQAATILAKLEWERAQRPGNVTAAPITSSVPRYFNIGCAAYSDGDVTGIEIVGEEIRLVRWPDDTEAPVPQVLIAGPLIPWPTP